MTSRETKSAWQSLFGLDDEKKGNDFESLFEEEKCSVVTLAPETQAASDPADGEAKAEALPDDVDSEVLEAQDLARRRAREAPRRRPWRTMPLDSLFESRQGPDLLREICACERELAHVRASPIFALMQSRPEDVKWEELQSVCIEFRDLLNRWDLLDEVASAEESLMLLYVPRVSGETQPPALTVEAVFQAASLEQPGMWCYVVPATWRRPPVEGTMLGKSLFTLDEQNGSWEDEWAGDQLLAPGQWHDASSIEGPVKVPALAVFPDNGMCRALVAELLPAALLPLILSFAGQKRRAIEVGRLWDGYVARPRPVLIGPGPLLPDRTRKYNPLRLPGQRPERAARSVVPGFV
jgi:hypothetical protein